MLTVAVACEAIASFIATAEQRHFTITICVFVGCDSLRFLLAYAHHN
ncbi:hypothetical protein [Nostoc sp. JL33]|nr:hypothetical protein [Nostoc sp. JL33]MBN3871199.1 hypothetical protein [Nostoc sp. JL33]